MKKLTYQKPAMRTVQLQHRTMLLTGSDKGYEVIGTDEPNLPAGRSFRGNGRVNWDDDWSE